MKKVGSFKEKIQIKSIKTKLVVYFSLLILTSSIALGSILLQEASKIFIKDAEGALVSQSIEASKLTEARIETQMRTLEMIALREDIQSMNWEIQQPMLKRQIEETNFIDIAVVQFDGTANYSSGTVSQLGDRDYVKKALNGEKNVSDLIVSRVTNDVVLMYAVPIKNDNKVVGALIGRRDGNALSEITDDVGYGKEGYSYVINNKGVVVAHPDREKVFNQFNPIEEANKDTSLISLATLFKKIVVEKVGVSQYYFEGNDLYAGYAPIEGSDWIYVITANQKEVLSVIPTLQKTALVVVATTLLVSIIIIYLIGSSIAKPIILVVGYGEKLSNLDITQDVPEIFVGRKDEVGLLAKSFQNITDNLREILKNIGEYSDQIASTSEELSATTEESAATAQEVARTSEEISRSAADQAQNTEEGSSKAIIFGEIIEEDSKQMQNLNEATTKVSTIVQEGLKETEELYDITEKSSSSAKIIFDMIQKTNESSIRIEEASNVISAIAKQTNLLALNAAIEAARAGDAGRGFAVVAEEIKKLAEESTKSTVSINKVVGELQSNAQEAVKTMEDVSAIVMEQTKKVVNNREKYNLITDAMKDAEDKVKILNVSSEKMGVMKDGILNVLQNLSAIAQENSAATDEVTASMEEQTAAIEEIAGASEGLANLALNLQEIIRRFKV